MIQSRIAALATEMNGGQRVERLKTRYSLQPSARGCGAPKLVKPLEVESHDYLRQPPARILSIVYIPIGQDCFGLLFQRLSNEDIGNALVWEARRRVERGFQLLRDRLLSSV